PHSRKMRTFIIIAAFVATIYAIPQPQDESPPMVMRPSISRLAGLMPKFLKEASNDARKEFWQILRNNSNTIAETQSELQAWAAKQGDDVRRDFGNAGEKLNEMIESLYEAILQSSLSTEAKNAFAYVREIVSDKKQTFGEEIRKVVNYIQSLSDETRQEMRNFLANAIKSAIDNDNLIEH
uniref:SXP/RAL-2 family protein Ani s 5-like cation-binding domain-containing protein n=1 Tax=Parascaris univalens TaxID=6257 RepID=A0A914ZMW9_PARUN